MVALASPTATEVPEARQHGARWRWAAASVIVLLVGIGVRLALGQGVGDRSAAVMTLLLALSGWAAAYVLSTPRAAFFVTLGLVMLLDLAALPARNATEYDDRQALYRTDQTLVAQVPIPPAATLTSPVLTLLVEPTFAGAQPQFGLAGDISGTTLTWNCAMRHGLQRLALPVPRASLAGAAALDARLHLTGSPRRDGDYLLVYAASGRGGVISSLVDGADVTQAATICSLT